jgi:hypothetical protein
MPPQKKGKKIVERYGLLNNLEGQMKIKGKFNNIFKSSITYSNLRVGLFNQRNMLIAGS